jgi:peptidoglycan/xylan/chitin deacetylase (PgdA/CDA1 family)
MRRVTQNAKPFLPGPAVARHGTHRAGTRDVSPLRFPGVGRTSTARTFADDTRGFASSVETFASCAAAKNWGSPKEFARYLRAAGSRGAKNLANAVLPQSVVAWRGRGVRGSGQRPVALTFDDGPSELTHAYLDVLKAHGGRATFFLVGERCEKYPELVSAIADGGHELGGHGYTHRRFPTLRKSELRQELTRTAALLPLPNGKKPLVRPPHGAFSLSSIWTSARAGFTTVLWSHDSGDWCTRSAHQVCAAFDKDASMVAGAIVLLHEGQPWTLDALPTVLGKLSKEGHELVTVGELLDR